MARTIILGEEKITNIRNDVAAGLTQREVGRKYDLSTTKIREALGLKQMVKKRVFTEATVPMPGLNITASFQKGVLTIKVFL
ncbi:MAG: hypothetical protein ACYC49_09295 [Ignavibacteriaceae bacterium]